MTPSLLVLFDIDGTLLLDDAYTHGRAMVRAMNDVWGVDLRDDVVEAVAPWGKTDQRIAREALATVGIGQAAFEAQLDDWIDAASRAFDDEVGAHRGRWRVRDDLPAGLEQLSAAGMRSSLVTGNLRPIAEAKVREMGLAARFDTAIGAYGDDAEERVELVPIARRRAGSAGCPWPRERTVVVGDTPGDVAAAQADSVPALIFPSDRFPPERLPGASRIVADVPHLVSTLRNWHGAG